jgi:hypothetical protein
MSTLPFAATYINGGLVAVDGHTVFIDAAVVPFPLVATSQFRSIRTPVWAGSPDHYMPKFDASRVFLGWYLSSVDPTVNFSDALTTVMVMPAY